VTAATVVLWIHLAAVAVWTGGIFALVFVALPALRSGAPAPAAGARLAARMMGRFQRISRELLLLVLLTGLFNLMRAGTARGFDFEAPYVRALFLKAGLFAAMVLVQGWQALRLTPDLAEAAVDASADTLRPFYRRFLGTSLALLLFAFAAMLLGLELGRP
jgi:putative copper export protein